MEMDIYMRRRLVALGGLVAFFIFFVLLVKSCGGDDETEPLTPVGATGEQGAVALTVEEFIDQADAICEEANSAVGALDPTDPDAVRDEFQITSEEFAALQALDVEQESGILRRFFTAFSDVVDALRSKQAATQRNLTADADEAQVAIDVAEAEARELGDSYGFSDCGQWLDAGEAPGGAEPTDTTDTSTDTSGGIAPPTDTAAPTDTAPTDDTTTPPADDDTGGITP